MKQDNFSIILPVYNGAHYIENSLSALVDFFRKTFVNIQLVLVDDGSNDNSLSILKSLERKIDFSLLHYKKNYGKGFAIKKVIASGVLKFEKVIVLDSDLPPSIDISQLFNSLLGLNTHSVVVMSRYHKDSRVTRLWHRKIISICHRVLIRILLPKIPSSDPDIGFKAFKLNFLKECIQYTNLNRWSWDLQVLAFAFQNGHKVLDMPFHWNENYEKTTIKLFKDSFEELAGMIYIRWQLATDALTQRN